jgi:hypothetical protein
LFLGLRDARRANDDIGRSCHFYGHHDTKQKNNKVLSPDPTILADCGGKNGDWTVETAAKQAGDSDSAADISGIALTLTEAQAISV